VALFENPHGEVPEHVGNGKANPIPMVLTAAQMLQHIGETAAAARIRKAIDEASLAGLRTYDQGGTDGIAEVEAAILARL
jgi:isocitrate/isopropylmalate dehydrogenase